MPVHGITAEYKPFSFNDYMAPVIAYQERYDKMQDALASKYDEIGAWKGLVDPNSTAGKTLTHSGFPFLIFTSIAYPIIQIVPSNHPSCNFPRE